MVRCLKLFVFAAVLFSAAVSQACPLISGMVDFNCDRKLTVVVLGDSLAFGFGDTKNGNKGGYVLRASKKFPQVDFINLGEQGLHTSQLLSSLRGAFDSAGENATREALLDADIVILDVGRNDRWEFGLPIATQRNLKRAASFIKTSVAAEGGVAPMVVTAVLMLPNRGSQGPWVKELNTYILKSNKAAAPADLRFDLVSKRLLGSDQIHPTSEGYASLAATFIKYLQKTLPPKMKKLRPDLDVDGIYDMFEAEKFGTDPTLPDTDGDGVLDGAQVFSNPNP